MSEASTTLPDVCRLAVQTALLATIAIEAELGGDDQLAGVPNLEVILVAKITLTLRNALESTFQAVFSPGFVILRPACPTDFLS
jgi:hypothetical protein